MAGQAQFVVAIASEDLKVLDDLVGENLKKERKWLEKARKDAYLTGLRGSELTKARREIRARFEKQRAAGRFQGTRDLVVAAALTQELQRRGMDGPYDPIPAGHHGPGRRWGTVSSGDQGDGGFDARMSVRLPVALADQLRRACYWANLDTEVALQAWTDRYGDGPDVILRRAEIRNGGVVTGLDFLGAVLSRRPIREAIIERDKLRAKIVTTGMILRTAVRRATGTEPEQLALDLQDDRADS
ncbi:hypothetical protein [Kitasatospora sp. NPDC056181]|uniref:hypothetical protein n=1 Tax=Kitasatospora sp. NPDC056181 TaxID=3345737 RepID=UPI0035E13654